MVGFTMLVLFAVVALAAAQDYQEYEAPIRAAPHRLGNNGPAAPRPTPIPILKQINKHNEDGSYTYGYEGADGSFKIETKLATGEVKGKYGYVDGDGKVRTVEYGANKYGFQPSGEGITVAPPTLVDETTRKDGSINLDYEDGSYYAPEQQQQLAPVPRAQAPRRPQPRPVAPQYQDYDQYEPQAAPVQVPQHRTGPAPPRAQIAGAAPTGIVYSPQPRPPRPEPVQFAQPAPRPQTFFPNPAPVRQGPPQQLFTEASHSRPPPQQEQQQVQYEPRPQPQQQQRFDFGPPQQSAPVRQSSPRQSGGYLDQLAKDYALPSGGSPALHDISFGFY